MHKLILWVRSLRKNQFFKISMRMFTVCLLVLGTWVATRNLELPAEVSINDKVIHAVVFFGFSLLMDLVSSRHPFWLWKGLPLLIYGITIEIMQYFSPDRTFSLLDWMADFFGILLYFIVKVFVLWMDSKRVGNSKY